MSRPSRYMPPIAKPPAAWWKRALAFSFLTILGGAYLWLLWKWPLPTLGLSVVVLILSAFQNRRRRLHLHAIAEARAQESICTFVRSLPIRTLDPWVVRAVFEQLQDYLHDCHMGFPLRRSDRLVEDLRIDLDDLDECLMWDIARRSGRSLSNCRANPHYGKVTTVEALIRFFCAQPKSAT
jgi:hypothetical protein